MSGSTPSSRHSGLMAWLMSEQADAAAKPAAPAARIAEASVRLIGTARLIADLADRIDDPAMATELRQLVSRVLEDVQVVSESVMVIANRIAAR